MNNKLLTLFVLLITIISIGCVGLKTNQEIDINELLKNASSEDTINLPNRIIYINTPIIISKSNVFLIGDTNTVLFLESNKNCPVIIVGVQEMSMVSNICISNIKIDGNRTNQSKELWKYSKLGYPIYNNGIIIQNAQNIFVDHLQSYDCISGGFVTTFGVSFLMVSNYTAFNNQFDGLACYQTTNSVFVNLFLFNNLAAGISLDMDFNYNFFDNIFLAYNTTGIFIRNSHQNIFQNVQAVGNKKFDIFMASVNEKTNTGCLYNDFTIKGDGKIQNNDSLSVSNIFRQKLGN